MMMMTNPRTTTAAMNKSFFCFAVFLFCLSQNIHLMVSFFLFILLASIFSSIHYQIQSLNRNDSGIIQNWKNIREYFIYTNVIQQPVAMFMAETVGSNVFLLQIYIDMNTFIWKSSTPRTRQAQPTNEPVSHSVGFSLPAIHPSIQHHSQPTNQPSDR